MTFSTRRCIQWAEKTAMYRNPYKGAEAVFLEKVSVEDKAVLLKNMALVMGGKAKVAKVDGVSTPKVPVDPNAPKKHRGRPKGSKNKV